MTSLLLQPEATMVDGVGLTSLPDHSVVVEAGYSAESLYVANKYGTNRDAIERAWAAGLPVMLNYEGIEDDAKNGYQAGVRAAKLAIVEARKLGFDGDAPLPFSAADRHFADIAGAGLDYHRALVDVFTADVGWIGGAYGFREMLELLSRQDWWPDTWPLWHWGGDGSFHYPWAWAKQGPGGSYFNTIINRQVDHNVLLKPMRFWSGYGSDPFLPDEETGMTPEQEAKLDIVVAALTHDPGTGITMEWAVQSLYDSVAKGHLATQVAQAVVASLPASGTSLTKQDITDAVNEAMRLITLNIGFGTG